MSKYKETIELYKATSEMLFSDFSEDKWARLPDERKSDLWDKAQTEVQRRSMEPPKVGTFWRLPIKKTIVQIIDRATYGDLNQVPSNSLFPTSIADEFDSFMYDKGSADTYYRVVGDPSVSYLTVDQLTSFYEHCTQITDESEVGMLLLRVSDD